MGICACESTVVLTIYHCVGLLLEYPTQCFLPVISRTPNSPTFSLTSQPYPVSAFSLSFAGPSSSSEPQTLSGQDSALQCLLHLLTQLAIPSPCGCTFHECPGYIHPPSCHFTFLSHVPTSKQKRHLKVNVPSHLIIPQTCSSHDLPHLSQWQLHFPSCSARILEHSLILPLLYSTSDASANSICSIFKMYLESDYF